MKVIMIGASTSGLFAGYLLAKEGVEVEVYEKGEVLGCPPRTLIVTDKINDVLDFIPEEAIVNRVRYLELFTRSRSARLELGRPDLIVERERFVNLLARLAEGKGAKVVLGHRFVGFTRFGRKIVATLQNLETGEEYPISADILVGADGASSTVSHAASGDGHHLTAVLQARVPLPEDVRPDTSQVWFDSNQTKYFYWLIPESREVATVGLIADNPHKAETCLKKFLQERDIEPLEFQAATVPMYRFKYSWVTPNSGRNVFVVGDAAAQVKMTTVGGLVTGLHGARALANAILNGKNYGKELRELRIELNFHLFVRHMLNRFNDENYDELIGMLNGGLKDILEKWTRDELAQIFWKLILTEPRLATLGAKTLLRSIF